MSTRYIERDTQVFKIEQLSKYYAHDSKYKLDPSTVRINEVGLKTVTYDLGCIVYKNRKSKTISKNGRYSAANVLVAPNSICKKRIVALDCLIEYIFTQYAIGAKADSTLCLFVYHLIRFCRWCDDNSFHDYMLSINKAREALQAFNDNSIACPIRTEMSDNTVVAISNAAVDMYSQLFEAEPIEIRSRLDLVARVSNKDSGTNSPDIIRASTALATYNSIFDGLSDLVLDGKPYPYSLELPNEKLWVFPTQIWFRTRRTLEVIFGGKTSKRFYENLVIDYAAGRYRTYENIRKLDPGFTRTRKSVNKAIASLESENTNLNGMFRKRMAHTACKAFVMMFIANTGMNLTEVAELEWDDSFEFDKGAHGFRAIKKRAGGKEVEFFITAGFFKYFRKYIRLRKYLLGERATKRLFFHCGHSGLIKDVDSHTLKTINETCRNLTDGKFKHVTARQWRSYRSNYLHKKHDIATIAMLMQNEIDTTFDSYTSGNRNESDIEMSEFLEEFAKKIIPIEKTLAAIPSGRCKEHGKPINMTEGAGIQPDCKTPEGCLFCENYAVQEDEECIRKLLSMEYVILEAKDSAETPEQFQSVHGKTLKRINDILNLLKSRSKRMKELIKKVKIEVNEEEIDPYWDAQLSKLFKMGIIF